MAFIARIFQFLFWLLVVSWSVAILRRVVGWMMRSATGPAGVTRPGTPDTALGSRRLVRDPVCGMHVSEHIAIPMRDGSELIHFCSASCRDRYESQIRRKAASA